MVRGGGAEGGGGGGARRVGEVAGVAGGVNVLVA